MKRSDKRTRDLPESLRIDAVASEAGILEWKIRGKLKHERNEFELASRIRKNTGQVYNVKSASDGISYDDTSKGRGFSSLHILIGVWSRTLRT